MDRKTIYAMIGGVAIFLIGFMFILDAIISGGETIHIETESIGTVPRGGEVIRFHDDELGVTCWIVGSGRGISCVPDWVIDGEFDWPIE